VRGKRDKPISYGASDGVCMRYAGLSDEPKRRKRKKLKSRTRVETSALLEYPGHKFYEGSRWLHENFNPGAPGLRSFDYAQDRCAQQRTEGRRSYF